MARPKKTVLDYAKEAAKRRSLSGRQLKTFSVYYRSLATRVREAKFAMQQVSDLYNKGAGFETTGLLSANEQMFYRCSVFVALAYSSFDVLANVANAVHNVHMDEREVAFTKLATAQWAGVPRVRSEAERIVGREYFKRLYALRNCALHRRSLPMERHVIQKPHAYMPVDSTDVEESYVWLLADDPYELDPQTKKNREVMEEFSSTMRWLNSDVVEVLKKI